MTLTAKITMKPDWQKQPLVSMEAGVAELMADVHKRAIILAPKESGALRNSSRISRLGFLAYQLVFGSQRVPYARIRHFENKKNPGTLGYLARAADAVNRSDKSKYFRNKL